MPAACIPPDYQQENTRYQEECIKEQSCDYKIQLISIPIQIEIASIIVRKERQKYQRR
jgi:hypothetical protein